MRSYKRIEDSVVENGDARVVVSQVEVCGLLIVIEAETFAAENDPLWWDRVEVLARL